MRTRLIAPLLLATALSPPAAVAEEVLLDGIAAQVGSEIVLLSEVQELARPVEDRMRAGGVGEAEIRNMHSDALERLIEAKLIEGVVHRLEFDATEAEVDNAIRGIAQDTGLTTEQLKRSVESHGLTVAEYREKIRGEIERSKVLNAMVRSRIRVEPEEVRAVYEERFGEQKSGGTEVHLRHILVAIGNDSMRDERMACLIAEDARQKIVAGEIDFPDMARRVTDMNPQAAGELGWFHVDDLAPWMVPSLTRLQPGETSEVIPTAFGCNLLQLVDRRTFERVTLEDAEPAIVDEISRKKMDKEYLEWLETLRRNTYVARKGLYSEGGRVEEIVGGRDGS